MMKMTDRERDIAAAWAQAEDRAEAAEARVKELEAKLAATESKLDRVGKLFDERYAELPDHVFDEMCNALERFPHSFHG